MALRLMNLSQRGPRGINGSELLNIGQMDTAKKVEVQRKQVDEVFNALDKGAELEQSDPGG